MGYSLFQSISGLLAATLVLLALRIRASQKRARLPPGPKPLPLIGNLRDMPSSEEWLTWQSYVERYGDLVFLTALGSNYLILGSQEAINDVIEKRAHVNGRPSLTMLHDLMDIKWLLASMPYGEYWRQSRKIIHTYFHAGAATEFEPIQIQGARRFVRDLLAAEQQSGDADRLSDAAKATLPNQIRLYLARTGVRMTYGIDLCDSATEAKYIDGPEAIMRAFGVGATPGRFLVDYFPILKYIPSWVPGAEFQLYAKKTAMLSKQVRDDPVAVVKAQMTAGTAPVSLAAQLLESVPDSQEQLVKDSVASMLLGAGDTSSGAITAFFLAMVAHPEVQKRAQEELDRVVGRGRLPEYSDKKDLVYIEAVIRETLRWLPVAPSGAPHMTERDDEYRGFFIPKGTLTIPLQWNVLRDHKIYPEPETFSPDRYLTRCADGAWAIREDVLDPRKIAFGFGRRVCPGTHIAEQTLFVAISTTLHTVDIMRAKNSEGKEIMPEIGLISGLVCHPRLFAYELRMRDDARELVNMGTTAVV